MKKKMKKLALARETVRTLTVPDLANNAYGGIDSAAYPGSCTCASTGCFSAGCESRQYECFCPNATTRSSH
jgi:hypothetical protein